MSILTFAKTFYLFIETNAKHSSFSFYRSSKNMTLEVIEAVGNTDYTLVDYIFYAYLKIFHLILNQM